MGRRSSRLTPVGVDTSWSEPQPQSYPSMASEIANVLVATLSADPNTRIAAELRINELFRTPGPLSSLGWHFAIFAFFLFLLFIIPVLYTGNTLSLACPPKLWCSATLTGRFLISLAQMLVSPWQASLWRKTQILL